MALKPASSPASPQTLPALQVWSMAFIFLAIGLAIGWLFPGSTAPSASTQAAAAPSPPASAIGNAHSITMQDMKQMADQQAAPLLAKLKSDPNNPALLAQLGAIYHITHQFQQAAAYYGKAVDADPDNVVLRTRLASSLFRAGDVDGALAQLNLALKQRPSDANALFDLGMIRLQGKGDGQGAVAAWQQLLKANPQLSPDRKATVANLIAGVMATLDSRHPTHGERNHDGY